MSHPDIAFSPWYVAPRGVENEVCSHNHLSRCRVGSTSRKNPHSVLVDKCARCGHIQRSANDLTWPEYFWVRRLNAHHD